MSRIREAVTVPLNYPTATFFVDESGSKATAGKFMIFGALKVRQPGFLAREVRAVRDKTGFANELKFSGITRRSLPVYYELIGALHRSDAHIVGTVVDGSVHDPFRGRREDWKVHAEVISQLVYGCVNKRELVSVMMDAVSTPPECSIEEVVRTRTNRKLGTTGVISALCLDSKSNDLLQLADMVAGAIMHQRRRAAGGPGKISSDKTKVAEYLAAAFNRPGLTDGRDDRVNIATYRPSPARRRSSFQVVTGSKRAG